MVSASTHVVLYKDLNFVCKRFKAVISSINKKTFLFEFLRSDIRHLNVNCTFHPI